MIKNNLLFTPLELQIESLAGYYDLHKFTKRIPLTECPPQAKIFVISVRYKGDFPLQNERRRRFFRFRDATMLFRSAFTVTIRPKKISPAAGFFPYGNAIWPKVAYGNRFGNPPPAPGGGLQRSLVRVIRERENLCFTSSRSRKPYGITFIALLERSTVSF